VLQEVDLQNRELRVVVRRLERQLRRWHALDLPALATREATFKRAGGLPERLVHHDVAIAHRVIRTPREIIAGAGSARPSLFREAFAAPDQRRTHTQEHWVGTSAATSGLPWPLLFSLCHVTDAAAGTLLRSYTVLIYLMA
jgi:hypothetical protein